MTALVVLVNTIQQTIDMANASLLTSVNTLEPVVGSEIDASVYQSVSYSMAVATNDVQVGVYGANASDFSDEVAVDALASIAAGAQRSYAVSLAPYRFYRVKADPTVDATHGTVTVKGVAKN